MLLRTVLVCLAALAAAPATASAAPGIDIRGTWRLDTGFSVATITWTSVDCTSGALVGSGESNGITWPEQGTLDGMALTTISGPYSSTPSYTYFLTGTFSNRSYATGTFKDTFRGDQVVGGFTLQRMTEPPADGGCSAPPDGGGTTPPPPDPGPHPTATQVMCTYTIATSLDTCTATVGDAAAQPTTPTGTVTFGKTVGAFLGDGTCVLQSSPSAPSTASCAVTYQRPFGSTAFPDISAVYGGDVTHAASAGSTSFLILGGPPSFSSQYPNQLSFETVADADGTSVTVCATASSKSVKATASADLVDDLEKITQQIRQMDDAATVKVLPALQKALDRAREQLERNRAEYEAKLRAGDKQGAAAAKKQVDEATTAIDQLSDALSGQCKATTAPKAKTAIASAAAAAAAKRKRTALVLGTRSVRNAKAGKLPITLKLAKAKVKKARKSKKTVTIYVHVLTRTPSGLVKKGWPRVAIYPVKVTKDGRVAT